MDPVTAIQLASAVFTFIQAGAAVLKTAREIRDSADGLSGDSRSRRVVVGSMEGVIAKLMEADKSESSPSLSALVSECQNLSGRIKECLEKIETSRLGRFGAAGKALFKKNELEGLETRLDRCRSQLEVELGNLRDERLTGYFETLVSLAQHNSSEFKQLSADVKQLSEGVQRGQIGSEARDQLKDLLGIQEQAVCTDYIVRSLRFDGMGKRYESVQQRNQKTFKWIFENEETDEGHDEYEPGADEESLSPRDSHTVERLEMKREAREKFLRWLSSPTGIFHVSGKLGSGKSTLMKFLYNSHFTRAQVENWAGSRKLVFANVFFWKPGSEMQKSLDGLFRSLLYGILQKFPDLTREVLHEYWAEAERTLLQSRPRLDIPPDAIRKALEEIITNRQVNKGRCFCFFLDALDEYDDGPRHQHDQLFLVDLLQRWVKASDGRLALCVSSREDNVFMNAFPETQRLQLHKLTLFDIRNYTRHALARFSDEKIRNHLIKVIPHRAEGIFLWAVLVIKNLRSMIPDGHIDTHELDELLDELPSELEDLLKHIIARFTKHERKTAYQVMKLLRTANTHFLPLTLLAFSFLGEYKKDQTFAFRNDFPTSEMQGIREDDASARYNKQLRRVCGGLVELRPPRFTEQWGDIEFTHRSVPEMFEESELKEAMESALTGFNPVLALSHLFCAQTRFLNNRDNLIYPCVVEMLLKTGAENGSYMHSEFIDSQCKALQPRDFGAYSEISLPTGVRYTYTMGFSRSSHVSPGLIFNSVLCNAVKHGHTKYVRWKLRNDPHALDDPLERSVAVQLMFDRGIKFWTWDSPVCTRVFNDESRVRFVYYRDPESGDLTTDELNTWERHLVWGFLAWEDGRHRSNGRLARCFGEVAELFLQHGAAIDLVVLVKGARERNEVILRFDYAEVTIKYWKDHDNRRLEWLRSMRYGKGDDRRDTHVTLREWIQATDLENKARLLDLIDSSRERVLERCDTSRVTDVAPSRVEEEDKAVYSERKALGGKDVDVDVEVGQVSAVRKVALGLVVSVLLCSVWARLGAWKGR